MRCPSRPGSTSTTSTSSSDVPSTTPAQWGWTPPPMRSRSGEVRRRPESARPRMDGGSPPNSIGDGACSRIVGRNWRSVSATAVERLPFSRGSVRVEPTNELRWSLLARARAQVGRARDGLLAIEAAKEQLMDVGLLPGRQLLLAEQAILSTPLDVALEDAHGLDARPVDARDVDARDGDRRHSVSAPAPLAARLPDELAALRAERFVARARPLELLDQALERVIGRGVSEVVVVVGEPGAGKTALVAEALARGLQERAEVHYGWAASRGGPAFGPWCTALRRAAVLDSTLFASPAGASARRPSGGHRIRWRPLRTVARRSRRPAVPADRGGRHRRTGARPKWADDHRHR